MRAATSISITFIRAADDPEHYSPEYQRELRALLAAIIGAPVRAPILSINDRGAGEGLSEEHKLDTQSLNSATVAALLIGWLDSHRGRELQIKIGNIKEKVNSVRDLEMLLTRAGKIEWAREPKRAQEP